MTYNVFSGTLNPTHFTHFTFASNLKVCSHWICCLVVHCSTLSFSLHLAAVYSNVLHTLTQVYNTQDNAMTSDVNEPLVSEMLGEGRMDILLEAVTGWFVMARLSTCC